MIFWSPSSRSYRSPAQISFRMNRLLLAIQFLIILLTGHIAEGGGLGADCYPNGTITVHNPDPSLFTNVVAVLYEGSSSAEDCSTSLTGSSVLIDSCSFFDTDITVHFSNRAAGSPDSVFGGSSIETYLINCNQIASTGISRTIDEALTVSLEATSESSVTPSFYVFLAIRRGGPTGIWISNADVGETLTLSVTVPGDYYAREDCYAYGNANGAGPSVHLFSDGCRQDTDLVGGDFDTTTTRGLRKIYYVTLYAFKFYRSNDLIIDCTVLVCPNANPCTISCGSKKRSVSNSTDLEPGLQEFHVQTQLHINTPGSHATTTQGSIWTMVGALLMVLR